MSQWGFESERKIGLNFVYNKENFVYSPGGGWETVDGKLLSENIRERIILVDSC